MRWNEIFSILLTFWTILFSSHFQASIDLAESLISLGFARKNDSKKAIGIVSALTRDEQLRRYYDKLDKIQANAKRNRRGLWASVVPPSPWPLSVINAQLSKFIYNKILPAKLRLPELVRWLHSQMIIYFNIITITVARCFIRIFYENEKRNQWVKLDVY